jgi:AcrR family transcriptional regulator
MAMTERAENGTRARAGLSRGLIVTAAIEVIDREGVDGLTMRRLGAELAVDPMAVYAYFENKAALLDAVVEHEASRLGDLQRELPEDAIEAMVHIARYYRAVLLEHPNLAPLVTSRPLPQQEAPEFVALGVHLFQLAGIEDEDIPAAFDAVVMFVLGFVLMEAGRTQTRAELADEFHQQQRHLRDRLAELPYDTTLAQAVVTRRLDDDASTVDFETGVRAMLEGLRRGLGRPVGAEVSPPRT